MKNQITSRLLAIIALVAIGIYCIHCRPAWSPHSDKIAYVYWDERNGDELCGIAIYDLNTSENQSIVEVTEESEKEALIPIEVFWPKKGNELIYVSASSDTSGPGRSDEEKEGKITVSKYHLSTKETKQIKKINVPGVSCVSSLYPVILERERWVWIAGQDEEEGIDYYRVDIKKEKWRKCEEAIVFGDSKKLFFVKGFDSDDEMTFGKIRTRFFYKESILFTVRLKEAQEEEAEESVIPILAVPEKRTLFAYLKGSEDRLTLRVVDEKGKLSKEIKLPESIEIENGANPMLAAAWNPEGNVLWLGLTVEDDEDYVAIAEIDIEDGSVRLLRFEDKGIDEEVAPLHFALSPDKKYLAASVFGEEVPPAYLCLIDLTTEERTVTFIHPPGAELSSAEGEK